MTSTAIRPKRGKSRQIPQIIEDIEGGNQSAISKDGDENAGNLDLIRCAKEH